MDLTNYPVRPLKARWSLVSPSEAAFVSPISQLFILSLGTNCLLSCQVSVLAQGNNCSYMFSIVLDIKLVFYDHYRFYLFMRILYREHMAIISFNRNYSLAQRGLGII